MSYANVTRSFLRTRHIVQCGAHQMSLWFSISTSPLPSAVGFNNYEEFCKNYRVQAPQYFNFASDVIDKWAQKEEVGKYISHYAFLVIFYFITFDFGYNCSRLTSI